MDSGAIAPELFCRNGLTLQAGRYNRMHQVREKRGLCMKHMKKRLAIIWMVLFTALALPASVMPDMAYIQAQAASTVRISSKKMTLILGQSKTLKITGTSKKVTWSSGKKSVASVSKNGKVTAKKKGTADIIATVGNKKYVCKVTVEAPKLSKTKASLQAGQSLQLKLAGTSQKITWKSSDTSVVKVSSSGKITARAKGKANVTATVNKKVFTCKVTISSKVTEKKISSVKLNKTSLTLDEGKSSTLKATVLPADTTMDKGITWTTKNSAVAKVSAKGKVTAVKAGTTYIVAKTSNNKSVSCKVTVKEPLKKATSAGFDMNVWSSSDTYKHDYNSCVSVGTSNVYAINFLGNGNEQWADKVKFKVTDVTPAAYKNMYKAIGITEKTPEVVRASAKEYLDRMARYGYVPGIVEPFTSSGPGGFSVSATAGATLKITCGQSTRAIKITASYEGKVLDTIYLTATGKDAAGNYSAEDRKVYDTVRHKVEAKLWKPGMSNLEKLNALADYINETVHYPYTDTVSGQYNPTFWKNWSVDGRDLLWNMVDDPILSRTMALQGGIMTCLACDIIKTAGMEDLKLRNLYNSATDTVESGEGVWVGVGSYSSAPYNPYHETCWYQAADGTRTGLDCQGMYYEAGSSLVSCEAHQCREKIVPLN